MNKKLVVLIMAGVSFSLAVLAEPPVWIWTGNDTSTLWSLTNNWQNGYAPESLSAGHIIFAGTNNLDNTNDIYVLSANSVVFSNDAGAFLLGGELLILNGAVLNSSTNPQTFKMPLVLFSDLAITAEQGAIYFENVISNKGFNISVFGTNPVIISGDVSGKGGLLQSNASSLVLSGNNSYSGATFVVNGECILASPNALAGSTSLVVQGSSILNHISSDSSMAGFFLANNRTALVSGSYAHLISSNLTIGVGIATNDGIIVENGAHIWTTNAVIGENGTSCWAGLQSASIWSNVNSFVIGAAGAQHSLLLSGGASLYSYDLLLGETLDSLLELNGGNIVVENTFEIRGGTNLLNNGSIRCYAFLMTNGAARQSFSAGYLNCNTAYVSNSIPYLIGDGSHSAVFFIDDSGYYNDCVFAEGLIVNTNASLILNSSEKIADNTALAINSGSIELGINSETLGTLTLNGASINAGGVSYLATTNLNFSLLEKASVFNITNGSLYLSNNIIGDGSLIKRGAGDLFLSGTNSYSGGTLVDEGQLIGDIDSIQGNLTNLATVVLEQNFDGIFSGTLNGDGEFYKEGVGLLVITGNTHAFNGNFYLDEGALQLDCSFDVPEVILMTYNSTLLMGTGLVQNCYLLNGSKIAPGTTNSEGMLTFSNLVIEGDTHYFYSKSAGKTDLTYIQKKLTFMNTNQPLTIHLKDNGGADFTGTNVLFAFSQIEGEPVWIIDYGDTGMTNGRVFVNYDLKQVELLGETPFVAITNPPDIITVSYDITNYLVQGFANFAATGLALWTNSSGYAGSISASAIWEFSTPLVVGSNNITITVSNLWGDVASDDILIIRGGEGTGKPVVAITNVAGVITCSYDVTNFELKGTNNIHVFGNMIWTNESTARSGIFPASLQWSTIIDQLAVGTNIIKIFGSNLWNEVVTDTVWIVRGPEGTGKPYTKITNVIGTAICPYYVSSFVLQGTNNKHVVGTMLVTNISSGYASSFAASTFWEVAISNLMVGTNIISVLGTNSWSETATDTVFIVRSSNGSGTPILEITNIVGSIITSYGTTSIVLQGTHNEHVVGEILWQNDQGGSGSIPANSPWQATINGLVTGTNIITVQGSNYIGEMASRSVSVIVPYGPLPETPQNVSATDGSFVDKIRIIWSAAIGATSYQVWRDDEQAPLIETTSLSFDDTTATCFHKHSYRVRSVNSYGASVFSQPDYGWQRSRATLVMWRADFDGDGKSDPAAYSLTSGDWLLRLSSRNYELLPGVLGGAGYIPITGDYDGDGRTDFGVYRISDGFWVGVLSESGQFGNIQLGNANALPIFGDFDGDGKSDPAVFDYAKNCFIVKLSDYEYTLVEFSVPKWNSGPTIPAPADYDGDNKADPALYEPHYGALRIWLSSDAYREAQIFDMGSILYQPLLADFDGDSKADPAVYSTVSGNWKALLSSQSYVAVVLDGFGGIRYAPVPSDFDGDGLSDPALYDYQTGYWRALLSAYNYMEVELQCGANGFVPLWWE